MSKIALVTGAAGDVGRCGGSATRVTGLVWSIDGGCSSIRPLVE